MTCEVVDMTKDGPRALAFRPELLPLCGGDPWKVLILQQLCYWTSRSHDPEGWVHKTAGEMREELGADEYMTERSVRRKLMELVELGVLEDEDGFQRRKRYRVRRNAYSEVDAAIEASRGPSSIVHSDRDVKPIRTQGSESKRTQASESGRTRPNDSDVDVRTSGRTRPNERTYTSETRTEITTEITTEMLGAVAPAVIPPLDDWISEQVEAAGRKPLPVATVQVLCMRLAEYSRPQQELYVLEALGNMHDLDDSGFRRAIVKGENIQRYIRPPQQPEESNDRSMTAEEYDRLVMEGYE